MLMKVRAGAMATATARMEAAIDAGLAVLQENRAPQPNGVDPRELVRMILEAAARAYAGAPISAEELANPPRDL